jgi:hypothetical protein
MKRLCALALLAAASLASASPAFGGTFGLFYCGGHCGHCCSYCVRPVNAFTPITCAADICGGKCGHGKCCGCAPFYGPGFGPACGTLQCGQGCGAGYCEGGEGGFEVSGDAGSVGCNTCWVYPGATGQPGLAAPAPAATAVALPSPLPAPGMTPALAQPVSYYPASPAPAYWYPAGR